MHTTNTNACQVFVKTVISDKVFSMTGFNYGIEEETVSDTETCVTFDSRGDFEKFCTLVREVEQQAVNLLDLAESHTIELLPLHLCALSTQLRKITGDTYNVHDFINANGDGLNANEGNIIVHIKTGLKFLLP